MLFGDVFIVWEPYETHKYRVLAEFHDVKADGTYSNHWALRVKCEV
jgi:hypothetical protein